MRKTLMILSCLLVFSLSAHASIYEDDFKSFQIMLPENWQMIEATARIDKEALFEIHFETADPARRTLIGAKTSVTQDNRDGFTFANSTDSEKAAIYAGSLKKASVNLPEHHSIDSHGFKNYGDNTFLVTTISHTQNGSVYNSITAITYSNKLQYTFYFFVHANNTQAFEDFDKMLSTLKILN